MTQQIYNTLLYTAMKFRITDLKKVCSHEPTLKGKASIFDYNEIILDYNEIIRVCTKVRFGLDINKFIWITELSGIGTKHILLALESDLSDLWSIRTIYLLSPSYLVTFLGCIFPRIYYTLVSKISVFIVFVVVLVVVATKNF